MKTTINSLVKLALDYKSFCIEADFSLNSITTLNDDYKKHLSVYFGDIDTFRFTCIGFTFYNWTGEVTFPSNYGKIELVKCLEFGTKFLEKMKKDYEVKTIEEKKSKVLEKINQLKIELQKLESHEENI